MPKRRKLKIVERKLGREKAWGLCWQGENLIELDPRLKGKKKLNLACHELAHLVFPSIESEREIERIARIFANALWSLNYRQISK